MQMPENYKVEDGKLTIFVDELEFEFLEKSDFIYSDKGKILLKHHAITVLAQGAGIAVGMPVLLSSHDSNSFVIAREAVKQNGARYSAIGEANTKNLWSEYLEQYPAETADNRAYDRAVLGIAGVYGKIYSTSEFSYQDAELGEKKVPKKEPAIAETKKPKQEPQNESVATERRKSIQSGGTTLGSGSIRTSSWIRKLLSLPRDSARIRTGRSNSFITTNMTAAITLRPEPLKMHQVKNLPCRCMPAGVQSEHTVSSSKKSPPSGLFLHSLLNRK